VDIKSLSLVELQDRMSDLGKVSYRALQVYKWIWQRGVHSFDEMTNISKATRAELDKRFFIPFLELCEKFESTDGTIKFVWVCADGSRFESVFIPDENRATLCMSTQVGCAMACTFCLTGDLGLKRNLAPSEIANQPLQVQALLGDEQRISNLVLMGMGEPLHNLDNLLPALEIALDDEAMNFSHRKITVSTVGLVPQMARLAEALPVNLAVSLNATTEEQRLEVMPITRRYSLETLLNACRAFPLPHAKRITFEYVMMAGFNDSLEDAHRLAALMQGIKSKVNLIPYNENPDRDIQRPTDARVKQFQHILIQSGLQCSVRVTRGRDISAACGQLGKAGAEAGPTT
jgi:23S rRNA (adenine2503-C2)-methyltransferase